MTWNQKKKNIQLHRSNFRAGKLSDCLLLTYLKNLSSDLIFNKQHNIFSGQKILT